MKNKNEFIQRLLGENVALKEQKRQLEKELIMLKVILETSKRMEEYTKRERGV